MPKPFILVSKRKLDYFSRKQREGWDSYGMFSELKDRERKATEEFRKLIPEILVKLS